MAKRVHVEKKAKNGEASTAEVQMKSSESGEPADAENASKDRVRGTALQYAVNHTGEANTNFLVFRRHMNLSAHFMTQFFPTCYEREEFITTLFF